MKLKSTDLLRYALWLGVVGTAKANRDYYGLPTTWAVHLTLNSLSLFMPELYRGASTLLRLDARAHEKRDLITAAHGMMQDAVVENPNYALYVAPVALAYIVSHPEFNIYKGNLAELRLFGFGLDAIPHSTTAFAFTNLVIDALAAFRRRAPANAKWYPLAERAAEHSALVAGSVLVGASALYELGEYAIHNEELRETNGDETKI
ncbi:MAG: hypothetical protein L0Y55_12200, partial [Anaerolineales bacterium]|nr:hypothetical protein [Anaerolineales bacterium]